MPERTWRFPVVLLVCGNRPLQIVTPQIADCCHLDVPLVFDTGHDAIELAAAIADTNVPQRDPIVRSCDARMGQRRAAQRRASRRYDRALLQKFPPVNLAL